MVPFNLKLIRHFLCLQEFQETGYLLNLKQSSTVTMLLTVSLILKRYELFDDTIRLFQLTCYIYLD